MIFWRSSTVGVRAPERNCQWRSSGMARSASGSRPLPIVLTPRQMAYAQLNLVPQGDKPVLLARAALEPKP